MTTKSDDQRISEAGVAPERHDTAEADDPTPDETHSLRRGVIDASLNLERKQRR